MTTPVLQSAEIVDNGVASNTLSSGSTTTGVLSGTPSSQDSFHLGCMVEVTADSSVAANVGEVRNITTYVGSTGTFTVNRAFPGALSANTTVKIHGGNHLKLTYDVAATHNSGSVTVDANAPCWTNNTRAMTCVASPVYGDGTTTPVVSLPRAVRWNSSNAQGGMGLVVASGETVTCDIPADTFRNGVDGNAVVTGQSVTNSSTYAWAGNVHIISDWVGEDETANTTTVYVMAFHPLGFNNVTITATDGVTPQSSGAITSLTFVTDLSAPNGGYWCYEWDGIDNTALNDGKITVTATINSDYGSRSDVEYYYNQNGGSLETRYFWCAASTGNDANDGLDALGIGLVNATYDHTGNGEGERHLSSTGAFSSYTFTSGDQIYLRNAAGGVAEGLYEIASKVDNDAVLLVANSGLTAASTADVDSSNGPVRNIGRAILRWRSFGGTNLGDGRGIIRLAEAGNYESREGWSGLSIDLSQLSRRNVIIEGDPRLAADDAVLTGHVADSAGRIVFNTTNAPSDFSNLTDIPNIILKHLQIQSQSPITGKEHLHAQLLGGVKITSDVTIKCGTGTHRPFLINTTQTDGIIASGGSVEAVWIYGATLNGSVVSARYVRKCVNTIWQNIPNDGIQQLRSNSAIFNTRMDGTATGIQVITVRYTGSSDVGTIECVLNSFDGVDADITLKSGPTGSPTTDLTFNTKPLSCAVYDASGTSYSFKSTQAEYARHTDNDLPIVPSGGGASGDRFLIGFESPVEWVEFDNTNGTQGVGGAGTWRYSTSGGWSNAVGVTDGTSGFTAAVGVQRVSHTPQGDWVARAESGITKYWLAFEVSSGYSTEPLYDYLVHQYGHWGGVKESIDGLTDWTCTLNDSVLKYNNVHTWAYGTTDAEYSPGVPLDAKTADLALRCAPPGHGDLFQIFEPDPLENIGIYNLHVADGADAPGLSSDHQPYWMDHVGPNNITDMCIVGSSLPRWRAEAGAIVRAGHHGSLKNFAIVGNTIPHQGLGLIYGSGTAGADLVTTNFMVGACALRHFQDEGASGYDGLYIDLNGYNDSFDFGDDSPGTNGFNDSFANTFTDALDPAAGLTGLVPASGSQLLSSVTVSTGVAYADQSAIIGAGGSDAIGAWPAAAAAGGSTAKGAGRRRRMRRNRRRKWA